MIFSLPFPEYSVVMSNQILPLTVDPKRYPPIVSSENKVVSKLKEYHEVMDYERPEYLMAFMRIPDSKRKAKEYALEIAHIVREYWSHGFLPILIFEPSIEGEGASLGNIQAGHYDEYIDLLFFHLAHTHHIEKKQLWLIVPYPEINTPAFSRENFLPTDFPWLVNNFFQIVQKYYPDLRWSILLDSKTYEGTTWSNGKYLSLKPYVEWIESKYVESFWLQGFPWISEDGKQKSTNVRTFLPASIIFEASGFLKTRKVWFNTGTIGRKYSGSIQMSPNERARTMNALLSFTRYLKQRGYTSTIHIFGKNNSSIPFDTTDWSYLQSVSHTDILRDFIKKAHDQGTWVGFFDI